MRVLMIVQLVDEHEWLRGFTVGWIRALAKEAEHMHVLTLEHGQATLPDNVTLHSMGKEKGYGRGRELVGFYRGMGRVIRDVDVIFSHMTPRYTWLAAPMATLFRKPQMLWFTHRQVSLELRAALAASTWITTATASSFPIQSPKVHALGHGIDTEKFKPDASQPEDPPLIVAVGRITPIKHHHILLEAAAKLRTIHPNVRFAILGKPAAGGDDAYLANLIKRRAELGLSDEDFQLPGAVSPDELVAWYRRASLVTNLSPVGLFDKAALEAMLTGTPVLVSNPAFDSLLGDYQNQVKVDAPDNIDLIVTRLSDLLNLAPNQRQHMGMELRQRTAAEHGLERLMREIVKLMQPN